MESSVISPTVPTALIFFFADNFCNQTELYLEHLSGQGSQRNPEVPGILDPPDFLLLQPHRIPGVQWVQLVLWGQGDP